MLTTKKKINLNKLAVIFSLLTVLIIIFYNPAISDNNSGDYKLKPLKSGIKIFPDEYSELDETQLNITKEDDATSRTLERARQKYVQALILIEKGDTNNAARYFERSIEILNSLVSNPGIEENEQFTDLAQSIIEDYESFVQNIDNLDDDSPLFIFRDKLFLELEAAYANTPRIQSLNFKPSSHAVAGFNIDTTITKLKQTTIPLTDNEYVQKSIIFLTENKGRKYFKTWLERSGRWFPMMKKIAAEEGVPEEIIYLSMIESGLNPNAVSRAKAVGLWQFIRTTGEMYELNDNPSIWIDERRDPEKSTRAAMRHLRDLYNEFGDWHLALAAYNCGAGGVRRAMLKASSENPDFWEIRELLPRETRNYVPLYIATAKIALNQEIYGFVESELEYHEEYKYDTVILSEPVCLEALAKCAVSSVDEIKNLNPELLRSITPPDIENYTLKIPYGAKSYFINNYAALSDDDKKSWIEHTVKRGETITRIAQKYRISKDELVAVNDLKSYKTRLKKGTTLKIPFASQDNNITESKENKKTNNTTNTRAVSNNIASNSNGTTHTVQNGETLYSISKQYGIKLTDLRSWNKIPYNNDEIKVGTLLKIAPDASQSNITKTSTKNSEPEQIVKHVVKSKETLTQIAEEYNITIESIRELNNLKSDKLRKGQVLKIQTSNPIDNLNVGKSKKSILVHKVRKGETLSSIADKYGVSISDLKNWNPDTIEGNSVFYGTRLKIYGNSQGKETVTKASKQLPNYYRVRKGDTFSSIAQKFGLSINDLKSKNKKVNPDKIRIGQKIRIK